MLHGAILLSEIARSYRSGLGDARPALRPSSAQAVDGATAMRRLRPAAQEALEELGCLVDLAELERAIGDCEDAFLRELEVAVERRDGAVAPRGAVELLSLEEDLREVRMRDRVETEERRMRGE